jgi:hypothetical protein
MKAFLVFQFWVTGTWFLFGIELHPNPKSVIKSQKVLGYGRAWCLCGSKNMFSSARAVPDPPQSLRCSGGKPLKGFKEIYGSMGPYSKELL